MHVTPLNTCWGSNLPLDLSLIRLILSFVGSKPAPLQCVERPLKGQSHEKHQAFVDMRHSKTQDKSWACF